VNNRRIVITGFMGSGKTDLAIALARHLECESADLDDEITRACGRSPAEIISQDGEPSFRTMESVILRRLLQDEVRIIALGGGAWTISDNRDLIAGLNCFSVWLDVPFDVCWSRITAGGVHRPLAPERQQAERLFEERRSLYSLAELHLEANDEADAAELARKVESALARSG
jgi:shikimate kinase